VGCVFAGIFRLVNVCSQHFDLTLAILKVTILLEVDFVLRWRSCVFQLLDVDPNIRTKWVDEASCHAEMRDAGKELVLRNAGVVAADVNWIVSGLIDLLVQRCVFVCAGGGGGAGC
jgi:hypothetical protein